MKIYISGPISGRPEKEVQARFGQVAQNVINAGHEPINPANISHWKLTWETYMQIAGEILKSGEIGAICMMDGWTNSKGALLEWVMARAMRIPVIYLNPKDRKTWGGAK